jgi:signal transduction histidine kinase
LTADKQVKTPKTIVFLICLCVYVLLQFLWWSYLMQHINHEVLNNQKYINTITSNTAQEISYKNNEAKNLYEKKSMMIIGEGTVFLIILLLGMYYLYKSLMQEIRLNSQQKNFILSVTHELKSPLASAQLQLQTILKRNDDKELQHKMLTRAINDLDRLNTLTENILTATQFDTKNFSLHLEFVNISNLTNEILLMIQKSFQLDNKIVAKNIEDKIYSMIDVSALSSILKNLVENALKYSPAQSTIEVKLYSKENKMIFEVNDLGIGIAIKEQQKIFERFYRVGNEEVRSHKGTGLGLYICKTLVLLHKGTIAVKPNIPKGSSFVVCMPIIVKA